MNTPAPGTITPSEYYDAPDTMATDASVVNKDTRMHDTKAEPTAAAAPALQNGSNRDGTARPERPTVDTSNPPTAHERAATAENSIPHSATSRLSKDEVKDAKRVSKVLKNEGRTDAMVMKVSLTELERLQKLHKEAAKDEATALGAHGKAIKTEHKLNMRFLDAQAKHNAAVAELNAREGALNATKEHVKKQADLLHEKEAEIEGMRSRKAVDDREREAKLKQLTMKPTTASPV